MAIKLTEQDHNDMDEFLGLVLDTYHQGETSRSQAIAVLAQVLTAAAIDNHGEVLAWFKPSQYRRWAKDVQG
jgi:hypothetical protein